MEVPPLPAMLKALVAPARHSDGPTLYLICRAEKEGYCAIYEQTGDGETILWPESPICGVQQAEEVIYRWSRQSR